MIDFNNISELNSWLVRKNINISGWGIDGNKTLENLWREIELGDARIHDNPPMRVVNVVQVFIRRGNLILLETIQEFSSGQRRFRNLPPAEKIKVGEHFLDAAARGLFEELGVLEDKIVFNKNSHFTRTMISESSSYPGLLTRYTFHDIEAAVEGLPKDNFWHDNDAYSQGDPIKRHFWEWSLPDEINGNTTNLNTGALQK